MQKEKKTYKHINIKDLYTISYIYIVKKKPFIYYITYYIPLRSLIISLLTT